MSPASNIYHNGLRIIDKQRLGNALVYSLEDGTQIKNKDLGKIDIQCHSCEGLSNISLYHKIYDKKYQCQSCGNKGENNAFYGRQHKQELKDRLSQERKGQWCVGESNAMYGKNVKDYVTPEKFEEMREKNRQDTLSREYNPFKYSMRDIVGDERFEQSIAKARETVNNWSEERKQAYSKTISDSQKRLQQQDPEKYRKQKTKAGRIAASNPARYQQNKFETAVGDWLLEKGFEVQYSPIIGYKKSNLQYDWIIRNQRILVECHGAYWHGDPRFFNTEGTEGKRKLNITQLNKQQQDKVKQKCALINNFKLLVVWEHDIITNKDFSYLERELL